MRITAVELESASKNLPTTSVDRFEGVDLHLPAMKAFAKT